MSVEILSSIGYVLVIISLFMCGMDKCSVGEGKGACCSKMGLLMAIVGFILLLVAVWI